MNYFPLRLSLLPSITPKVLDAVRKTTQIFSEVKYEIAAWIDTNRRYYLYQKDQPSKESGCCLSKPDTGVFLDSGKVISKKGNRPRMAFAAPSVLAWESVVFNSPILDRNSSCQFPYDLAGSDRLLKKRVNSSLIPKKLLPGSIIFWMRSWFS